MIYGEEIPRLQIHTLNGGDWLTPVDQPLSGLRPHAVIGMSYPPSHPVFLLIPASACRAPFLQPMDRQDRLAAHTTPQ